VLVGALWIGPPWESAPADARAVVIDPGRAFGTGAHATTRLCVKLLLEAPLFGAPRGSVLDVGCGSGVLAIAAARLGYGPVAAIDIDEAAVEAARANAAANGVSIDVCCTDALRGGLPDADLVVANVTLNDVEALGPRIRARYVIASGYLDRDTPRIEGRMSVARRELDGWAADLFALES
jgi:ribosomal protein L11 methyltransferase